MWEVFATFDPSNTGVVTKANPDPDPAPDPEPDPDPDFNPKSSLNGYGSHGTYLFPFPFL